MLRKAVIALAAAGSAACEMRSSGSAGLGAVSIGITSPVVLLALTIAIAGIVWPIWGVVRWKRGWRIAAVLPLVGLALAAAGGAYQSAHNPTSINVLPVYVLMTALLAGLYMIVLWIVRSVRRS